MIRPLARAASLLLVPLFLGALSLGCSKSSGGGGGGASTASPVATATTSPSTTATTTPSASGLPQTPASVGQPLTVFNKDIQVLWDGLLPMILGQLEQTAQTQLQGKKYTSSAVEVEIRNVKLGAATDMRVAPGLLRLNSKELILRAPVSGTWAVALEADVRVQLNVGSFSPAIDLPLTIAIENLWLEVEAEFDDSDPTRPVIKRVGQPKLDFTVRIDSTSSIVQRLTNVLNKPANWIANQAINLGLGMLLPQLQSLNGVPGAIPGDGAAPLADSGRNTPFEEVALNVELKLRQTNQPHGTVLTATMDTPTQETWLEAYRKGGTGNPGTVLGWHSGGDSAIWTGQYLAAEAFRYSVTNDSLALDAIGHTLKGVGALLDVNGGTGLLARVAAPEKPRVGQSIVARGVFRSAQLHGERWVGRQGGNGISRDQYSGIMFGLSIAYELVPAVRSECAFRIQQIVDYLIKNDWMIDEDRAAWNGTTGSRGPTSWAGINYQKLAFLLIAHRTDPARYAAELAQAGPLSKTAWMGLWTSTLGLDHYYKFNLAHVGLYNFFRLETDPARWQDMRRAYAIMERYVGHHRNPHFDLIQVSIDPSTQTALFPSIRESIRQFLDSPHREVAPILIDLSHVTYVPIQQFGYSNTSGGGFSLGGSTVQFPTEPLDVRLRKPSGHFQWQRDPFTAATPSMGDPRAEKIGLDLVLPYWMGRAMGAF